GPRERCLLRWRIRPGAFATVPTQLPQLLAGIQSQHPDSQPRCAGPGDQRRADTAPAATRVAAAGNPGPRGRAERRDRTDTGAGAVPVGYQGERPPGADAGCRAEEAVPG